VAASLDRRQFLGRSLAAGAGLVVVGGGASSLLAACSSNSSTTTGSAASGGTVAPGSLGTLDFQLSWIKNVEFAGNYFADSEGYYKAAGFSKVNLISGGPNVQQDSVVAAGGALVGISAPDITAPAILKGAPLIIIGALFQKNPFAIVSLSSNPIATPQDMVGKKIGVQSVNEPIWNAFLQANSLDPSSITKVPAQFDPTPLAAGEVDGWFSFITNEPNLLKVKGIDTTAFLLNDYNYPLVSQTYMVTTDSLNNSRDKVKAVLASDIQGWHNSLKDPAAGAALAVNVYGKDLGLDVAEQTLESAAQNKLILTDRTKTDGIMTITTEQQQATIATLKLGGTVITADKLFDMSVLSEVYEANPGLKTSPV